MCVCVCVGEEGGKYHNPVLYRHQLDVRYGAAVFVDQGRHMRVPKQRIFESEAQAAHWLVRSAPGANYVLRTDNAALAFALQKGRSNTPAANAACKEMMLKRLQGATISVKWIPTEKNPADEPSRLTIRPKEILVSPCTEQSQPIGETFSNSSLPRQLPECSVWIPAAPCARPLGALSLCPKYRSKGLVSKLWHPTGAPFSHQFWVAAGLLPHRQKTCGSHTCVTHKSSSSSSSSSSRATKKKKEKRKKKKKKEKRKKKKEKRKKKKENRKQKTENRKKEKKKKEKKKKRKKKKKKRKRKEKEKSSSTTS